MTFFIAKYYVVPEREPLRYDHRVWPMVLWHLVVLDPGFCWFSAPWSVILQISVVLESLECWYH
jgi:hypothetical protein